MADQTDERDFAVSPDSALGSDHARNDGYDDPPTGYNDEKLDPDVNSLFPDEPDSHIRWKGETEEQQHARTEATTHTPSQPSRQYSQDGNKPVVRSGSVASNGSGQAYLDSSNASSNGLDRIDMGTLFGGGQLEVVNTPAARRGADRPAGLDLVSAGDEYTDEEGTISSATFRKTLESSIQDPHLLAQLTTEFNELNERKNDVAMTAFRHLQRATTDYNELKSDYYSGAGDERRRIREEANLRVKERKKAKMERKLQMALGGEIMAARVAKLGEESGGWKLDPLTGLPISPEVDGDLSSSSGGDDDEEEDEDDDGKSGQREFYSDDEEGEKLARGLRIVNEEKPEEKDVDARQDRDDGSAEEWPGDRRSRLRLSAIPQDDVRRSSAPLTGNSMHSYSGSDKPLPSVPLQETKETIVSIQVLLRLLPVKVALITHFSDTGSTPNPETIYAICERADDVLKYAVDKDAALELQGRCRFYVGVAEYLRFTVNRLGNEKIEVEVIRYFQDARDFCQGVFEEGAWGREWAEVLNGEQRYPDRTERSDEDMKENAMGDAKRDARRAEEKVDRNLVTKTLNWMMGWDSGEEKSKSPPAAKDKQSPSPMANRPSSFGARFALGQGQKLRRPEDIPNPEDGGEEEEQVLPNNIFGGLVPIADLPQSPPKKQRPVGLGITTDDGKPLEIKNTVLSPSEGVFESPEKYAGGFGGKPTVDKVGDSKLYSPDSAASSRADSLQIKGLRIKNPDTSSATTTASGKDGSLPAPVTTSPAVSPGGSNTLLSNLQRRLSLAILPGSNATSPTSPEPNSASGLTSKLPVTPKEEDECSFTPGGSQRLPLKDRRRSSAALALHTVRSLLPGSRASARVQDSLIEAEEGNSPLKQTFDREEGKVKKSPLSPPGSGGDESGLRRRRSAAKGSEDMV